MKLLTALSCVLVSACVGDEPELELSTHASALITKEDPATTSAMRDKMSAMRDAYTKGDMKRYRDELRTLLQDAVKQAPLDLVKRYASLQVIAAERLDGYQPIVYRYATSIFGVASKIDPLVIKELRADAMLARTTLGNQLAADCSQIVRDALRGDFPEFDDLAGLACLTVEPEIHNYPLRTSGTILPSHDACDSLASNVVYTFDVPSTIPTTSITALEVRDLPFPTILTWWQDWSNRRWVSVYARQNSDPLPVDAQTGAFTIRVSTTSGFTDYPVTFPINHGLRHSCGIWPTKVTVGIGNAGTRAIYGSGPRTPARSWSASNAPGSGLPAGLTFSPGTGAYAGHGVVTGTPTASAVNGQLDVAYQQGTTVVHDRFTFEVLLRADPARVQQLATVQKIERGQQVSLALPAASGADGTYAWAIPATSQLPPGLALTRSGTTWSITGTVAADAPLEIRTVNLWLSSAGQRLVLPITFDCTREVKLYVQNMILFPSEIVDPVVDCLPAVGWPPVYATCIAAFEILEAIFYNGEINNTDDDNEQRATLMVGHVTAGQYDVVALQEVWDGPQSDAELDEIISDLSPTYSSVVGPGTSFSVIPPDFKINSGLLTLSKHAMSGTTARVFSVPGSGVDGYANKGFVATRINVTAFSDEFFWVINTHTNAEDATVRAAQLQQIADFVAALPDTNPVVIVGDLNVQADESGASGTEYANMMDRLDRFQDFGFREGLVTHSWTASAYANRWSDGTFQPDQRIDYVLVRQGNVFGLVKEDIAIVGNDATLAVTTDLCAGWSLTAPLVCHYSDHFGQRATLKLRRW